MAFEGSVKGGLGLIAYLLGNSRQWRITIAQLMGGKLYAPAGQVVHRRLTDQPREALRERRTR